MALEFLVPIESFFDPLQTVKVWPANVVTNRNFVRQLEQRRKLSKCLNDVIGSLPRPDMHLKTAIDQGHITEEQAVELYTYLNDLLSDDEYKRLVLYLPFEFLPDKTWSTPGQFRQTYLKTWRRLLWVKDVRANFVDGDVLEMDFRVGDLPRVVKAAHLIPKLVESGLVEIKEALAFMEKTDDRILKDSIMDALSFMGIKKPRIETAIIPTVSPITKNREIWLKKIEKQKIIEASAQRLSAAIIQNGKIDEDRPVVLIEGIRMAIEAVASTDYGEALMLYERCEQILLRLWLEGSSDIDAREALLKTFRRLHRLKIIDERKMAELHIAKPKLAGPFSENLELMEEISDISKMAASIGSNHELSQLIYPLVLVYGSRLSGYGEQSADIDLSVLVKPETSFDDRAKLRELLKKNFSHQKVKTNEIVEFWLEKQGDRLKIREPAGAESDLSFGKNYWTFILFNAAWMGDQNETRNLCGKLLVPYMYDSSRRLLYIEDVEQSTLLYRLMHKGYERFFPPYGGIDANTQYADRLDAKSMFWDSGYRQLALQLFVSKLFLPKLTNPS